MLKPRAALLLAALAVVLVAALAVWTSTAPPPLLSPGSDRGALRISDVRVVDVQGGTALDHRDVWIEGDRIVEIGPHDPARSAPRELDGSGASLVPGLIDAHCHVMSSPAAPGTLAVPDPPRNLERMLYSGITRTFDPGTAPEDIAELRDAVASGEIPGPHIHSAGPIFTAPGGHPEPMLRELAPPLISTLLVGRLTRQPATPAAARDAVAALAPWNFGFVKLVVDRLPDSAPRMEAAVGQAIVAEARAQGMRPIAHIGTTQDALDAAAWGVEAWMHGVYKERIPDADVPRLAAAGIPMVPTMVVFRTYGEMGRGDYPATALERAVLPEAVLAARAAPDLSEGRSDELRAFADMLRDQRQHAMDNTKRLHDAGVTMLAGSDAQGGVVHGPSLHRELALLERAGLAPIEVLRAATLNPARFLSGSETPDYGLVAEGMRAELLLVEGDPLAGSAALAEIRAVVMDGRIVERHARTE